MIPITELFRWWKNRKKPSVDEKIRRELDKIAPHTFQTRCCGFKYIGRNHSPKWDGCCRVCGRTWRGWKEVDDE